jgi:hypothetical protein
VPSDDQRLANSDRYWDNTIAALIRTERGALLSKTILSRTFRQAPVASLAREAKSVSGVVKFGASIISMYSVDLVRFIVVSLVRRGGARQGVARQEREARQDGVRRARRQDGAACVV